MNDSAIRVIVTGCRDWDNDTVVYGELAKLLGSYYPITVVVGDCKTGADAAARRWAESRIDVPGPEIYKADWEQRGMGAGPIRNTAMVRAGADLCLAFWDGRSRGTLDTIAKAVQAGIPVRITSAPNKREAQRGTP